MEPQRFEGYEPKDLVDKATFSTKAYNTEEDNGKLDYYVVAHRNYFNSP